MLTVFMHLWLAFAAHPVHDAATPAPARFDGCGDSLPAGAVARWGTSRFGRAMASSGCRLASNGEWLAIATPERIHLLDGLTGKEVWSRAAYCDEDPLFTPDGRSIVTGADSGKLALCDALTGKIVQTFPSDQDAHHSVAISGDGRTLAVAEAEADFPTRVTLWEIRKGRLKGSFPLTDSRRAAIALSPDGGTLACRYEPQGHDYINATSATQERWRAVELFDLRKGKLLRTLHTRQGTVGAMVFSPDGKALATVHCKAPPDPSKESLFKQDTEVGVVEIWDMATGRRLQKLRPGPDGERGVAQVCYCGHHHRNLAVVRDDGTTELYDPSTGARLERLLPQRGRKPQAVVFLSDGRILATTTDGPSHLVWDVRTGRPCSPPLPGHVAPIAALAFSGHEEIISVGANGEVYRWGVSAGAVPRHLLLAAEPSLEKLEPVLSSDGRYLACESEQTFPRSFDPPFSLTLWRLEDGRKLWSKKGPRSAGVIGFLPSSRLLLCTGGRRLDVGSGTRLLKSLRSGSDDRYTLAVTADGDFLAGVTAARRDPRTWSVRSTARMWDLTKDRLVRQFSVPQPHGPIALTPDHRRLALIDGYGRLILWDMSTGKQAWESPAEYAWATCLAFSPDSRRLAIAVAESEQLEPHIDLADVATGNRYKRWFGHRGRINCLAFSADGKLLASGGSDTTVLVWNVVELSVGASKRALTSRELDRLWTDLGDADANRASVAVGLLANDRSAALSLLRSRVNPVPQVGSAELANLIQDLDDRRFSTREDATHRLVWLGGSITPALRNALRNPLSLEARRRIQLVLDQGKHWTSEQLRVARAVEVLEAIGGPEARAILQRLAGGSPLAQQTRDATAALARLVRDPKLP